MSLPAISRTIWSDKYALPGEKTVEDTWRRIARALAAVEKDPAKWEERFYAALEGFKFLPAGRITAGAGTDRTVTLFNCFVMGTIPDSMEGIFQALKEAALTMQQGGGIGYDFSTIRPKNAPVKGVAADASGPLSFMDVWDAMCRTIMSAGSRRGAMMATLRCDHPDVEAFIEAKQDPKRLRMFNLSVLITDPFMEAVKANADWDLVFGDKVYRTVNARELWDKIMRSTYEYAEPGVIFIDRINKANNLWYVETISSTNPCGEQPLPPYGACLLGSINLAALVEEPFKLKAKIDLDQLAKVVSIAVRMMDNVVDASRFPLPQQEAEAKAKRRIGLGVTGLADALVMLGLVYGSDEAVAWTDAIMEHIARAAYGASIDLAKEKGPFPLFDANRLLLSNFMGNMPEVVHDLIREHGLRNALLTSIAPTGTISLYAGNISSGIEPIFAPTYTRKVTQPDGSKIEEEVVDFAVQAWRDLHGDIPLPDTFVSAQTLSPQDHVKMQAAAQRWVDSSISKTINCPEDISFEDFQEVYMSAWDQGCKGCTTYRPNAITGSILSVTPKPAEKAPPAALPPRLEGLPGKTYKLKWPGVPHAFYVTINDADGQPYEIFVNSNSLEHHAWVIALTRMISAIFRRGGDITFVAEELKAVFDPRGGSWVEGAYVPSLVAAIGGVIEKHMGIKVLTPSLGGQTCSSCGSSNIKNESGCFSCADCGHSKCG